MTQIYDKYEKSVEHYTNRMNLEKSVTTKRKGKQKIRDAFITYERFYVEGNSYVSLLISFILMGVTLMALGQTAIENFNLYWALFMIFIAISTIYFGYLSYTKLGLVNRYNEMNAKTDSGRFQLFGELQILKSQQIDMAQKIDELIKYHKRFKRKKK